MPKPRRIMPPILGLLLLALVASNSAQGAFVIEANEIGGDVVLEGSGTLDFSAWNFSEQTLSGVAIRPDAVFAVGPPAASNTYVNPDDFSGPASFGPGVTLRIADFGSGDLVGLAFGLTPITLGVPVGYVLGNPLSGSATFVNKTLDQLGMAPGTYVWSWGSGGTADSITLIVVGPTPAVPALGGSAAGLMLLLLATTGLIGARRTLARRTPGLHG